MTKCELCLEKFIEKPSWINGTKICNTCFIKVKRLTNSKSSRTNSGVRNSWNDYYITYQKKYATKKDINTINRINKFVEELKKNQ